MFWKRKTEPSKNKTDDLEGQIKAHNATQEKHIEEIVGAVQKYLKSYSPYRFEVNLAFAQGSLNIPDLVQHWAWGLITFHSHGNEPLPVYPRQIQTTISGCDHSVKYGDYHYHKFHFWHTEPSPLSNDMMLHHWLYTLYNVGSTYGLMRERMYRISTVSEPCIVPPDNIAPTLYGWRS